MQIKVQLLEEEMPREWYNLAADLTGSMLPPLGPDGMPVKPEQLGPVFPMSLIEQEVSTERWIRIPDEVLQILYKWRPTPLHRAYNLEKALNTPARIYYKNESVSPPGSHKSNTAVAQVYYNKVEKIKKMTTETGAGQWGSALAFACSQFGLECKVYMVRISFDQKPFRKTMMEAWGATCIPSPSNETNFGRQVLAESPNTPGSLGIAISEAIEEAVSDPSGKTKYCLGSVLNHVMLHQTIIGLETKKQLAKIGEGKVDVVIGCVGGGSNFAGMAFPFVNDKIHGSQIEIIPVEPTSCPTMTKAPFVYDHGDAARMTPLLPMHSLGHRFIPAPIHAGGLRYHGVAPMVSAAINSGLITPQAHNQVACYEAAVLFARHEGIIVAPETGHAIAEVIAQANRAREEAKQKVILFNLSGHGLMDMVGYRKFFDGELTNYELPQAEIEKSLDFIKDFPKPCAN